MRHRLINDMLTTSDIDEEIMKRFGVDLEAMYWYTLGQIEENEEDLED